MIVMNQTRRINITKEGTNGLTAIEAIKIANGMPISQVLRNEGRRRPFLQELNKILRMNNLAPILDDDSIKGRMLWNKEIDAIICSQRKTVQVDIQRKPPYSHLYGVGLDYQPILVPRFVANDFERTLTGTYVAYNEPGKRLGDVIKTTDKETEKTIMFEIPNEYRNEKNAILVVQHGFLKDGRPIITPREEGKTIIIEIADKNEIELLRQFPQESLEHLCYYPDIQFGIPQGRAMQKFDKWVEGGAYRIDGKADTRFLYRLKGEWTGLLVRGKKRVGNRPDLESYMSWNCASSFGTGWDIHTDINEGRRLGVIIDCYL